MNRRGRFLLLSGLMMLASSCVTMKHQLEQSKPLEINVNVRLIDDRLDDFYAFEQKYRNSPSTQPATEPADS